MEILFSLALIILLSMYVFSHEIVNEPLSFEPHEKWTKRNKWFVLYLFRALCITLNSFSTLPFAENKITFISCLIDFILYSVLLYLFFTKNKYIFNFIYFYIPLETLAMSITFASETSEISKCSLIFFLIWLLPNYVYFIKRRNVFNKEETNISNIATDNVVENAKID